MTVAIRYDAGGTMKETLKTDGGTVFDFKGLSADRKIAERFVRRLVDTAAKLIPDHEWTAEDVRDVVSFALSDDESPIPVFEARHYRKRLREEIDRSERYKQTFSTMIVGVTGAETGDEVFTSVLDALIERLRKTDMVFLYKKRVAIIMPHTAAPVLSTLVERIRALISAVTAIDTAHIAIEATSFPSRELPSSKAFLEWADFRLKD